MKNIIKKILNEEVNQKVISKVLSQINQGKIKPPYIKNLDMIGLYGDEIKMVMETHFGGEFKSNKVKGPKVEYRESSDGDFWELRRYDDNNNLIYTEDTGHWEKYEYDENNNEIFYITNTGTWEEREYDENGNQIYFGNSKGRKVRYYYDENGNQINWEVIS